jgi:hypothetical protein
MEVFPEALLNYPILWRRTHCEGAASIGSKAHRVLKQMKVAGAERRPGHP